METRHFDYLSCTVESAMGTGACAFAPPRRSFVYHVKMQRPMLVCAVIAILLQALSVSAKCFDSLAPASASSLQSGAGGSDGDAGCCSYCFCCHAAGALGGASPRTALALAGLVLPNWNPLPPEPAIDPVPRPPRA
jgi:hypothetical protein